MNGKTWNWYDLPDLDKLPGKIDMLVVDGPPWKLQHLARYPALPVLFKYLSDNAVIILDDGNRPDEKEIVKLWKKEYDCFEGRHLDTQREVGFFERKK